MSVIEQIDKNLEIHGDQEHQTEAVPSNRGDHSPLCVLHLDVDTEKRKNLCTMQAGTKKSQISPSMANLIDKVYHTMLKRRMQLIKRVLRDKSSPAHALVTCVLNTVLPAKAA